MTTLFAWVDCETTGLIEGDSYPLILELALAFTDDRFDRVGPTFSSPVWPNGLTADEVWAACPREPFDVFAMQQGSGLFDEWWGWAATAARVPNQAALDAELAGHMRLMKDLAGAETVTVAGSGVAPFDVPLLHRYFPQLMAECHYRPFDISTLRVMGRRHGVESPFDDKQRPHRAAGDVDWSIDEARWWDAWWRDAAWAKGAEDARSGGRR